jgi:hypothetical protein
LYDLSRKTYISLQLGSGSRFLDVIDPLARVCELCKRGCQIATVSVPRATECGAIRVVGEYVLRQTTARHWACKDGTDWMQLTLPLRVS